jgi:hypothetical protein
MATRSNIAYRTPEGRIVSIYCHWDGYPAHNGEMLRRYYTTTDKIVDLISLGSISSLKQEIGEKQDFNDRSTQNEDWTLAYHRDRGEQLVVNTYNDIPSWIADMEEYAYLWNGQEWLVNDHGEKDANGFPIFSRVVDILDPRQLKEMGWEGVDEDPAFQTEDA